MILGMSLETFVLVHVIISLVGIVAGLIVMFGMLGSRSQPGLTAIFLLCTILTSATGFLIPPLLSEKLLPSHIIGILSLALLAIACFAFYIARLAGAWRWSYVLTALAPGNPPSGPVFGVAQCIVLVFFVVKNNGAWRRFRPA